MNLVDIHNTITKQVASKITDYEDSAAYAYVVTCMAQLEKIGADPRDYELCFIESEYPEYVEGEDSVKMVVRRRLQLRKIPNGKGKLVD